MYPTSHSFSKVAQQENQTCVYPAESHASAAFLHRDSDSDDLLHGRKGDVFQIGADLFGVINTPAHRAQFYKALTSINSSKSSSCLCRNPASSSTYL
jgi:hypothetical protein